MPQNLRLLQAVLEPRGYITPTARSGEAALARIAEGGIDLVLLDIVMPGLDGHAVCRALRADPATSFMPVVMVTASGEQEKAGALESGADDFVSKPFVPAELLARVRSLLRIKRYHDTMEAQAAELERFNQGLEQRVTELRRFLSPQVAELLVTAGEESFLESHRREIAVVACGLQGFVAFAESVEPEDVMALLGEYHRGAGELLHGFEATVDRFTGDGRLTAFFNDPVPCPDPAARAVRLAVAVRNRVWELAEGWGRLGHELHPAVGVAQGHATLGRIGIASRSDYAAIGAPMRLAELLCEAAEPGQILIDRRVHAAAESLVVCHPVGELVLRGLTRPAPAFDLVGLDASAAAA